MEAKRTINRIMLLTGLTLFAAAPLWAQEVLPFPDPPMETQDRAYTSPIWYTPAT